MKKIVFIISFFIVIIVCLYIFYTDNSRVDIKFVKCIDGDTARFVINDKEESVRFLGIDAPESTNFVEEYGVEASDYVCDLLENADDIILEYDSNSDSRDKYNRILAWVFVDNNNLSELLLSRGYAEVKYIYGDYKYIDELCIMQEYAYINKLGIWNNDEYDYSNNYCNN